jgi:hypothetical protein
MEQDNFVHREQVKKNIVGTTLNKGVVEDAFKYDNETKYPKKGSEVKTVLERSIMEKKVILESMCSKATGLKEYIACEPNCSIPDYFIEDSKTDVMKMVPFANKIYDDKMCFLDRANNPTETPRGFTTPEAGCCTSEQQAKACRDYNSLVRGCCKIACEIVFCKTMHDNTEDGKTYQLNMRQIQSLKF